MTAPRPELEAEARNIWVTCYGSSPFTVSTETAQSVTMTSRCCEFHVKLALALATAHARGRAEGLEAAAQVAERDYRIFQAIRALADRGEHP